MRLHSVIPVRLDVMFGSRDGASVRTGPTLSSDPTMKAFIIDRYKPSDGGRIADVPEPVPADGQVLVQIHAAGVNLLDSKIRSGEFKHILPYRMPLILGNDVAGEVVRVGPGVRRFNVGDEVYARPDNGAIGTFAEFIAINEADVALKPRSLSMEQAASIPLVGLTAWQALVERANLQHGQKVFIQAGSGGVGTFAIQLAKISEPPWPRPPAPRTPRRHSRQCRHHS